MTARARALGAVVGLGLLGALVLAVPPSGAPAAGAAGTPQATEGGFSGLVLDGDDGFFLGAAQHVSLDDPEATLEPDGVLLVSARARGRAYELRLAGPDRVLGPGVGRYQASSAPAARGEGASGIELTGAGLTCRGAAGRFDVSEASYDQAGNPDTFAARFEVTCEGGARRAVGAVALAASSPPPSHQLSARGLRFGEVAAGTSSEARSLTLGNDGQGALVVDAVVLDQPAPPVFEMVEDACSGRELGSGETCDVAVRARADGGAVARPATAALVVRDGLAPAGGDSSRVALSAEVTLPFDDGGELVPVSPRRLFDSRATPQGWATVPLAAGSVTNVQVNGIGDVPASGVQAVTLNLTVTQPSGPGYVAVYPAGFAPPLASNLSFATGETVANHVIVPVGRGELSLLVAGAEAHVIVDVAGWLTAPGASPPAKRARLHPVEPARLVDTRLAADGGAAPIGPGATLAVPVTGRAAVPPGAAAALVSLAGTSATRSTWLSAQAGGAGWRGTSTLNVDVGETRANLATVPLSASGQLELFNAEGEVHVTVDVVGYYLPAPPGEEASRAGRVLAVAPARVFDSREGARARPASAEAAATLAWSTIARHYGSSLGAVFANVTATAATQPTGVAAQPAGSTSATMPNLFVPAGATAAALTLERLGTGGAGRLVVTSGAVHLVCDLQALVLAA